MAHSICLDVDVKLKRQFGLLPVLWSSAPLSDFFRMLVYTGHFMLLGIIKKNNFKKAGKNAS